MEHWRWIMGWAGLGWDRHFGRGHWDGDFTIADVQEQPEAVDLLHRIMVERAYLDHDRCIMHAHA